MAIEIVSFPVKHGDFPIKKCEFSHEKRGELPEGKP